MTLPAHSALTPREAQIVQRLVEGNTIREVAVGYGIAPQTVKNYVTVIYDKLGVRSRTHLLQAWQALPAAVTQPFQREHSDG